MSSPTHTDDMGGIPSWARVGAKVVCIQEGWDERTAAPGVEFPDRVPMPGEVLTINWVGCAYGKAFVSFLELLPDTLGWDCAGFRPVKTIEDDISEHFAIYIKSPQNATRKSPVDA